MIVVRDIFQIRFGKIREAIAVWKEWDEIMHQAEATGRKPRILTDFAGNNYYTLIMEQEFESLAEFEESMARMSGNGNWKSWYQKFIPLAESGHREILRIVE